MVDVPSLPSRPANAFALVAAASARAKQLLGGCVPKIDGSPKPARRALQELATGAVAGVDERPNPKGKE
jgi:DNA-directed RNA polymerase subunit K/omega